VDVRVAPPPTRRRLLSSLAVLGGVAGTSALGASGCVQRQQSRAPIELSWYSWGPLYPAQWTLGPGLNPRQVGFQRPPGSALPGQPTPVPPEKVLEQQIAAFTADRPDIAVKVMTEQPNRYHEKLAALAAAGKIPDVVAYDGPQAMGLIRSKALYNLTRLQGGKTRAFLQNFPTGYLDASAYRGKLYGIPYQSRQMVLYVNKTAFGGLSLPPQDWANPNWTWVHFLEKASALTHRTIGGGFRQFGSLLTGRPMWAAFIRQNGGTEFNREMSRSQYDSPEVYEAVQWTADLIHRYRVAPNELQNPGGRNWNFDMGTVAMWPWYQHSIPIVNQRVLDFDWDIYPLPMNRRAATYADWGYLSMSANVVDVDRAWELIRFLTSPDGDFLALREGVTGPIQRGSEPMYLIGSGDVKNKAAAIQAAHQPFAFRPQHESWDRIQALLDFYLKPVWSGEQKASYACRELRPVLDGVLADLERSRTSVGGEAGDAAGAEGE
jgi:multiple sugar transport system substrate-binding protein